MPDSCSVITATAATRAEANKLAEILVSRRLAACVQVLDITSTYFWAGKLNQQPECLLLIKTASRLYQAVEAAIVEHHSYEVPEVIELRVGRGLPSYLGWVAANTQAVNRQ